MNPPYNLFLDMVPSSSEDITRAMRGQLKPLCRNYLGRNGWNVIVYVLISFHSRDVLCTLSCLFVPPGFRWFCARLVVHYLAVYSVKVKFNSDGNEYNSCVSVRYNSVFISLPLFTKGHKTTT